MNSKDLKNSTQDACCSSSKKEKVDSCCEQPTDGSSCCDANESKEVNSKKTGCC